MGKRDIDLKKSRSAKIAKNKAKREEKAKALALQSLKKKKAARLLFKLKENKAKTESAELLEAKPIEEK